MDTREFTRASSYTSRETGKRGPGIVIHEYATDEKGNAYDPRVAHRRQTPHALTTIAHKPSHNLPSQTDTTYKRTQEHLQASMTLNGGQASRGGIETMLPNPRAALRPTLTLGGFLQGGTRARFNAETPQVMLRDRTTMPRVGRLG